ncbi:MAG: hypothetical protein KKD01_08645 [Proteobacteria bacterium]|nr:hypothetical protein [Pseudomonadota bacterium]MBU1139362.1 hypothetical protein [Pseudomonadota bacterium]MBU1231810.1 hypothetical protein [Pseudomonadota bacterium]MBU1419995.1 hypothetical protein [Pseudomonadota bacterium]MBU1454778.1 hypothetical protein [Pseudomonadota bacterium]
MSTRKYLAHAPNNQVVNRTRDSTVFSNVMVPANTDTPVHTMPIEFET